MATGMGQRAMAPKQVAESWRVNNPTWRIEYITWENFRTYVTDIDYIYNTTKELTPQGKANIIRLSLLKNHGGVWADATMLCMQLLDHWYEEVLAPSGLWMYHCWGGDMPPDAGPSNWFILAVRHSYMITKWKEACDEYWHNRTIGHKYFWMDGLFKQLFDSDLEFKRRWLQVPYLYCEADGQAHSLAVKNAMVTNVPHLKQLFHDTPPYALKFSNSWNNVVRHQIAVSNPQGTMHYKWQIVSSCINIL